MSTSLIQKNGTCAKNYKGASKRCSHEDCMNQAAKAGFCKRHYRLLLGRNAYTCSHEDCRKQSRKANLCHVHYRERFGVYAHACSLKDCPKQAVKAKFCARHYRETFGTCAHTVKKCSDEHMINQSNGFQSIEPTASNCR